MYSFVTLVYSVFVRCFATFHVSFHFIASYVCFTRFTCAFLLVLQEKSGLHLRDVESGFTGWPFACTGGVYEAIGFDRMHVTKGLIERMWQDWYRRRCP